MKIGNIEKLSPREELAPIVRPGKPTLYFLFKSSISPEKAGEIATKTLKKGQMSGVIRPGGKIEEIEVDSDKRLDLLMAINFIKSLDSIYIIETKTDEEGEEYQARVELPFTWETIDLEDYKTYTNYSDELEEFGLSAGEIGFVAMKAAQVNMVNDEMVRGARDDFLASR